MLFELLHGFGGREGSFYKSNYYNLLLGGTLSNSEHWLNEFLLICKRILCSHEKNEEALQVLFWSNLWDVSLSEKYNVYYATKCKKK